ncbi:ATP-binding protein, partial [Streptomyces sp. ADMS]|uniref:ATP-binding protein n=1 Tax=Streptomyces sp. ADMS TaxID=3071415 RepID=UPI00296EF323
MAPPSLPQPLGRLPRGSLAGRPDHLDHSPQSGMFGLPASPASVGAARRKVRELLDAWGVGPDTSDNALLVTSELVTNALTHTASERIVCRMRFSARRLHIEVEDENCGGTLPAQRRPGPDEQCGRGLLLVGVVSRDWGVRDAPHGSGRVVWAELEAERVELAEAVPPAAPVAAQAADETVGHAGTVASVGAGTPVEAVAAFGAAASGEGAPAAPDTPAPVRPASPLPQAPPADRAVQAAAPVSYAVPVAAPAQAAQVAAPASRAVPAEVLAARAVRPAAPAVPAELPAALAAPMSHAVLAE